MFEFILSGEDLTKFFTAASMDGAIENLLVEVSGNKLFSSAMVEKGRHAWILCQSRKVKTTGSGEFVLAISDISKILKLPSFKAKSMYECYVDENRLGIACGKWHSTIDLGDIKSHKDEKNSSYIPMDDIWKKRYYVPIVPPGDNPVPIPVPKEPHPATTCLKQCLVITAGDLRTKLADGRSLGCNRFEIKTTEPGIIQVKIETKHSTHESEMSCNNKGKLLQWSEVFLREAIEKTIVPLGDLVDIYLCMTDIPGPSGRNPGVWIGWNDGDKENGHLTVGYMISTIDPTMVI